MKADQSPRIIRWIALGLATLGLWLAGAYVLLPRMIRSAYNETSFGPINELIAGRAYHPVERYLDAGARLARLGTLSLVAAAVALVVGYRFRGPLGRWLSAIFRRAPQAGAVELVLGAGGFGLLFGLLESSAFWIRFRGELTTFNNPDTFWLAPLALAALFALTALFAYLVTGGFRGGLSRRVIVAICVTIGVGGVLLGLRIGLHPAGAWALALGLGVQAARMMDDGTRIWRALVRVTLPGVAVLAFVPVLLYPSARRYRLEPVVTLPAPASSPNVLLLVLDTVRGESLGIGGYARPTSPTLDLLAREGVVFDRAIAPSPWTLPTHASIFTGRYLHEMAVAWDQGLPEEFPTLAEELGARGYARGGFVANQANAGRGTGIERGFGTYVAHSRTLGNWVSSAYASRHLVEAIWPRLPTRWRSINRRYAPEVNREFLDWVDSLDGAPFFGFINYFDAHAPYEEHAEFSRRFEADDRSRVFDEEGRPRAARGDLARDIDAYDSSIAFVDHYVGELLDELRDRGLLDNTVVVVTADHGEHLGERGLIDHGNSLYSQLLVVPLVLYWPGRLPEGLRVEEPVSLRDLAATIGDLTGDSSPELPGVSLTRFWGSGDVTAAGPVLSEVEASPHGGFAPGPNQLGDMKSIVDGSLHYILNGDGSEELFDLETDPRDRNDLADTEVGRRELPRLRALLSDVLPEETGSR